MRGWRSWKQVKMRNRLRATPDLNAAGTRGHSTALPLPRPERSRRGSPCSEEDPHRGQDPGAPAADREAGRRDGRRISRMADRLRKQRLRRPVPARWRQHPGCPAPERGGGLGMPARIVIDPNIAHARQVKRRAMDGRRVRPRVKDHS